jgi:hypothetical protein
MGHVVDFGEKAGLARTDNFDLHAIEIAIIAILDNEAGAKAAFANHAVKLVVRQYKTATQLLGNL